MSCSYEQSGIPACSSIIRMAYVLSRQVGWCVVGAQERDERPAPADQAEQQRPGCLPESLNRCNAPLWDGLTPSHDPPQLGRHFVEHLGRTMIPSAHWLHST
uniref:Uncharacterized protein n=1 Tax=Oryza meridionalis TaxID=40149 RepID=A0A0E0EX09_9ORYZ